MSEAAKVGLFESLYAKLALFLAAFLLLSGVAQLYFSTSGWYELVEELEQRANWDLATEIAARLEPRVNPSIDRAGLEQDLYQLGIMNPKLRFFFLSASGRIIEHFAPYAPLWHESVSLGPIREALRLETPGLPLYGDDPTKPRGRQIFSVAPLTIEGQPGYLYLLLSGNAFEFGTRVSGQYYLVRTFLIGVAIATIAAACCGLLLFLYLTRHFRELARVAEQFGRGNFEPRLRIRTNDEIGRLAQVINQMADAIRRMTEELKSTDRQRRELIAVITHDLRGPITSMKGYLETIRLKGQALPAGERERYLEVMYGSVLAQHRLVSDLFELARIEAREAPPQVEPFSPVELADEVAAKLAPAAEAKQLTLRVSSADELPGVLGDPELIGRVLYNLVDNAIRFTPRGGSVTVRLEEAGDRIRFAVCDTGIGIREEALPEIFKSFYRAHAGDPEDPGGTGLGLAIVHRLLKLHGVEPTVTSRVNVGTEFSFSLRTEAAGGAA